MICLTASWPFRLTSGRGSSSLWCSDSSTSATGATTPSGGRSQSDRPCSNCNPWNELVIKQKTSLLILRQHVDRKVLSDQSVCKFQGRITECGRVQCCETKQEALFKKAPNSHRGSKIQRGLEKSQFTTHFFSLRRRFIHNEKLKIATEHNNLPTQFSKNNSFCLDRIPPNHAVM